VFLNSDDSVRELKGPQRPILPAEYRKAALLATRWVDRVVTFDEEDPVYQWRNFERETPDMYIKELGINITTSPEAVYLAQYNVPIVLINRTLDMSTTQLIELVRRAA
jgi:bifunctional ADP-heptose synthase (sugar kinase/adenylyltransferase)